MKKIAISLFTFCVIIVSAQDIPLPLNIAKAYENKTRSHDGNPGMNYWQNRTQYKIDAVVDPTTETIIGKASLLYENNSPDTLRRLVIRLYQDFFRKGNARQWPVSNGDLTDGTKITRLKIAGENYDPDEDFPRWWITNFTIRLKNRIVPHSTTPIEIDWEVKIPTERGLRMRKYADGHYFIAYWYPQIAVYDDIDGWDGVEYLGMVEFYNDINQFEVNLTVPGDYLVRSTGETQNLYEILQQEILKRYHKAETSDEVIRIITPEDYAKGKIFLPGKTHTWKIKAKDVPDFSFAMSTQSNWDGTSLVVDSTLNRRVLTDVLYPDGTRHWDQAAEISRKSVQYMSFKLPGVPFPYPHMTSFCAGSQGGGMETPMMANDGAPRTFDSFVELLFHEISHTYFPFYMGTNERKYAWMDEGWAAYLPGDFTKELDPQSTYMAEEINGYLNFAGEEAALPLMVPSYQHNNFSSARIAAYNHPAVAYHILRQTLGDKLFKKALHAYIQRWQGKHPIPFDFFNTFNEVVGENLDWFWRPWFFETGYPDLGIKDFSENNQLIIEKIGNLPIPAEINYETEAGEEGRITYPASVWKDQHEIIVNLPSDQSIQSIKLGSDLIPDLNADNNHWEK
ncbi:MAG: M1 family metallopeptidase [Bacteroidetes bacterium]|nr:M1 family metallopeptidase [Bacteroidota bacterium]